MGEEAPQTPRLPAEAAAAAALAPAEIETSVTPEKATKTPQSQSVKYRVVYKKVAVREHPDTKSKSLRYMRMGDSVDMYEWDATETWRRVCVMVKSDDGSGKLHEIDGWMLITSSS